MQPMPSIPRGLPNVTIVVMLFGLLIGLVSLVFAVIVWWRICSKAGYSGALGLLMLVPLANIVLLLMLAFGTWPIEEELRRLRGLARRHYE
jgi:energy-converting hydrogenase Eha subunit B